MNFDRQHNNQSRIIGIGFVVLLHAVLIWGLIAGLGRKALELLPAPIETKIIDEVRPPLEELPPPKPDFQPPALPQVPVPEINIAVPVEATANAIQQVSTSKAPAGAVATSTSPSIDFKHSPLGCRKPEYPTASQRMGEAGSAAISLYIATDGSIQQNRIDQSSGHSRLDDATIKAFSKCKFIVGTNGGKPTASWFSIRYKWVVPK